MTESKPGAETHKVNPEVSYDMIKCKCQSQADKSKDPEMITVSQKKELPELNNVFSKIK